jgi:hypothetical protein
VILVFFLFFLCIAIEQFSQELLCPVNVGMAMAVFAYFDLSSLLTFPLQSFFTYALVHTEVKGQNKRSYAVIL